jgi:hypothetical protein
MIVIARETWTALQQDQEALQRHVSLLQKSLSDRQTERHSFNDERFSLPRRGGGVVETSGVSKSNPTIARSRATSPRVPRNEVDVCRGD